MEMGEEEEEELKPAFTWLELAAVVIPLSALL